MPIYTPRGLKIRLDLPFAFALMQRLHPHVSAFRVLQTTEAIESTPGLLAFLSAITAFVLHLPPFGVGLVTSASYLVGVVINARGIYFSRGFIWVARAYSVIAGRGVLIGILMATGYLTVGIPGLVAYFAGKLTGYFVRQLDERRFVTKSFEELGTALTTSERSFFNAYRIHAVQLGATTNIEVADSELNEENWLPAFIRLATDWPEVTARFNAA